MPPGRGGEKKMADLKIISKSRTRASCTRKTLVRGSFVAREKSRIGFSFSRSDISLRSLPWLSNACPQVVNTLAGVSRSGSWCVCQIAAMEQQVVIDVDEQRLFAMSVQGFGSQSGGAIFRGACAMRSASD